MAALLLLDPGDGSRRSGSKFLRNCSTHNECKVFFEARLKQSLNDSARERERQRAVLLSAAGIRTAINFLRRENSAAREPGSLTGDSRGHTYTRDPIRSPLSPFAMWARVHAPTRERGLP